MSTELPSDERMRAWRLAGMFICSCDRPAPRRVAFIDSEECATCGKLIAGRTGVELVDRMVAAGVAQ